MTTENAAQPVSVVGTGRMGAAIAQRLLGEGHPTTVWNRSAHRTVPLAAAGATVAETARDAVAAGPLTFLCLSDPGATRAVLDDAEKALDARTLVNLTWSSDEDAREVDRRVRAAGGDHLDGVIQASPALIGSPECLVLYAGSPAVFAAHRETLRGLGGEAVHVDADPGGVALYNVALVELTLATVNAFLHTAAVMRAADTKVGEFAPLVEKLLRGNICSLVRSYGQQIEQGEYSTSDTTLETMLEAAEEFPSVCEALGVGGEVPSHLARVLRSAVGKGYGADGYARLVDHFAPPARADADV